MFDDVFDDKQWKIAREKAGLKSGLTEKVSMGDEFKRFQQDKTVVAAKVLLQKVALYEKQLKDKHAKEKYYAKLLEGGAGPEKGAATTALYLAGGKSLKAGDSEIERNEPGLAYVEKNSAGGFELGNPSPSDAVVSVILPALSGLAAYELKADGTRGAAVQPQVTGAKISLTLKAGARVVFAGS